MEANARIMSPPNSYIESLAQRDSKRGCIWRQNLYVEKIFYEVIGVDAVLTSIFIREIWSQKPRRMHMHRRPRRHVRRQLFESTGARPQQKPNLEYLDVGHLASRTG